MLEQYMCTGKAEINRVGKMVQVKRFFTKKKCSENEGQNV